MAMEFLKFFDYLVSIGSVTKKKQRDLFMYKMQIDTFIYVDENRDKVFEIIELQLFQKLYSSLLLNQL